MTKDRSPQERAEACGCSSNQCGGVDRRHFVKISGAALATLGLPRAMRAMAGPFGPQDTVDHFVPADKKLLPDWVKQLDARGERTWYQGEDLKTIGMPVGGICAGQVYLTGDGRLVYWGIYNQQNNSGYGSLNYKVGREPTEMVMGTRQIDTAPMIEQGFAIKVASESGTKVRSLDIDGFPHVRFCGEYPLGLVDYQESDFPVQVQLEAFSPFIPLNADDSSLPVTALNYRVKNTTSEPVEVTLAGYLQNGTLHYSRERCSATHQLVSRQVKGSGVTSILLASRKVEKPVEPVREPQVFADFEGGDYGDWQVEGESFGAAPARGTLDRQQQVSGFRGRGLVNTYLGGSDALMGKLISPSFTIDRPYISFLVGGGPSDKTAIRLIVEGRAVRTASGKQSERLLPHNWDVRDLAGRKAHLEIVDEETTAWGHINIDQIEFRDTPMTDQIADVRRLPDFGTMALSLLGDAAPLVSLSLPDTVGPVQIFSGDGLADDGTTDRPMTQQQRTALGRRFKLAPGEEVTSTFLVSWYMPNLYRGDKLVRNRYAPRFENAAGVAAYVAEHYESLASGTRLWHDTYYDSTLPYWLLDRLHSTVCNLATETCQWWENGRFWAFEGCGCCHGTCGHVWNYEHAMARLFPVLERSVREMQDFSPDGGFIPETGEIRFRGENWGIWAGDSQGGYILKAYREHQLCEDSAFLQRNWPNIRKAVQFLIDQDGNADGLLEGKQHQTYDQDYYGANTMVGSLYLGALRAAEEMAIELGEKDFAAKCRQIFERGSQRSVELLFDGEYFVQDVDLEKHPEWQYKDGCLADQMFGQGWAHQVNLGYLYPVEKVRSALQSIWKYCWAPDVGPQNDRHHPARPFAYPGEAGLFTCTWPKSNHLGDRSTRYRNEIWTGIEYQVANHMAYEGMVTEALAMCRAVHDRYHPSKHNPFNEIECGDHYARALASWGVLLGLAGFEYHGPQRHIGFAPRLTPDAFRVVFTTADGWGNYQQQAESGRQVHKMEVKWGKVALKSIALQVPEGKTVTEVSLREPSHALKTKYVQHGRDVVVLFPEEMIVAAGKTLTLEVTI